MESKPTALAWCAEYDNRIIALGGLACVKGRYYAFVDLTPEARPFKMTIARTAWRVLAEAKRLGLRYVYAEPDPEEPGAITWLSRLGFKPDPRSRNLLYRWSS